MTPFAAHGTKQCTKTRFMLDLKNPHLPFSAVPASSWPEQGNVLSLSDNKNDDAHRTKCLAFYSVEELQEQIRADELSRPEVIKAVWVPDRCCSVRVHPTGILLSLCGG